MILDGNIHEIHHDIHGWHDSIEKEDKKNKKEKTDQPPYSFYLVVIRFSLIKMK